MSRDPWREGLRAWHREERLRAREAARGRLGDGGGWTVPWARTGAWAQTSREAATPFGFAGGVPCGCHSPTCDACVVAGCGAVGCPSCGALGFGPPPAAAAARGGPGPGADVQLPDEALAGVPELDVRAAFIDAHAHHFVALTESPGTWMEALVDELTEFFRAAVLLDMKDAGVDRSVVMPNWDGNRPDAIRASDVLNEQTLKVAALDADFFRPFCTFFVDRDTGGELDSGTASRIQGWLDAGCVGVGELYIRSYPGTDIADVTDPDLIDVFVTAAAAGVPVAVHWNIGSVEDHATYDGAENEAAFFDLLDAIRAEGVEGHAIILCHCGVGPDALIATHPEWSRYTAAIERLIEDYPEVRFDLAGMQCGRDGVDEKGLIQRLYEDPGSGPEVTDLGDFLLSLMCAGASDRFLAGTDLDNRSPTQWEDSSGNWQWGADAYAASIDNYRVFLGLSCSGGVLDEIAQARVLWWNARGLLS